MGGCTEKPLLDILPDENERLARVQNAVLKNLFIPKENLTPDFFEK